MRILGIDYGDARIGTSVCDELQTLAHPLKTYKAESMRKNIDAMSALAKNERVGLIVVGLPLNMDGSEGARASKTRSFASVLSKVSGLTVELVDERLTSVEAEEIMDNLSVKKSKRKDIIDTIAAQLILQSYLDRRKKN
ncbi:MAG: Holliday junction resolvase RuvX [Clostridia bacterium]|nr:Holliday junction resolvase RuvX [Clostridia bacterium]